MEEPHNVGDDGGLEKCGVDEGKADGHENSAWVQLPALIVFDVSSLERTKEFVDFFLLHSVLENSNRPLATNESEDCLSNECVE